MNSPFAWCVCARMMCMCLCMCTCMCALLSVYVCVSPKATYQTQRSEDMHTKLDLAYLPKTADFLIKYACLTILLATVWSTNTFWHVLQHGRPNGIMLFCAVKHARARTCKSVASSFSTVLSITWWHGNVYNLYLHYLFHASRISNTYANDARTMHWRYTTDTLTKLTMQNLLNIHKTIHTIDSTVDIALLPDGTK